MRERGNLKKDENADSITVEKGILDTIENTQFTNSLTGDKTDVQLVDASKMTNSNELFEFVSNNSINEFSLTKFENGANIIGTSFKESSELSLNISASRNSSNINSYEHSHPMDFDGLYPSPADIQTAGKFKADANLRIYAPLLKQYKNYDANSPSFELKEVVIPARKSKK